MGRIVINGLILGLFLLASCKTGIPGKSVQDVYSIIEKKSYKTGQLYFKTLGSEKITGRRNLTYNYLVQGNVKDNYLTEVPPYMNFDSIFNKEQREEITKNLQHPGSKKLKIKFLQNPEILVKTQDENSFLPNEYIIYPFFVKDRNDNMYGFIYRSGASGDVEIYKKINSVWTEFARVGIWIE